LTKNLDLSHFIWVRNPVSIVVCVSPGYLSPPFIELMQPPTPYNCNNQRGGHRQDACATPTQREYGGRCPPYNKKLQI